MIFLFLLDFVYVLVFHSQIPLWPKLAARVPLSQLPYCTQEAIWDVIRPFKALIKVNFIAKHVVLSLGNTGFSLPKGLHNSHQVSLLQGYMLFFILFFAVDKSIDHINQARLAENSQKRAAPSHVPLRFPK